MDWQSWMQQHKPHTEFQRSGATIWLKGDVHLIDDPEGPYEHLHDHASEVLVFLTGRARLTMGEDEYTFGPLELAPLPPDIPHNLFNAGEEDILLFWLVAPNHLTNKWRTQELPPAPYRQGIMRAALQNGEVLPSDNFIRNTLLHLQPGNEFSDQTRPRQEAVILLVEGKAEVKVGPLHGSLQAPQFIHVTRSTPYHIQAVDRPAKSLLVETLEVA